MDVREMIVFVIEVTRIGRMFMVLTIFTNIDFGKPIHIELSNETLNIFVFEFGGEYLVAEFVSVGDGE